MINYVVKKYGEWVWHVIYESNSKPEEQIHVLKSILRYFRSKADIEIHTRSLNALKEGLRALEKVGNTLSPAGRIDLLTMVNQVLLL